MSQRQVGSQNIFISHTNIPSVFRTLVLKKMNLELMAIALNLVPFSGKISLCAIVKPSPFDYK